MILVAGDDFNCQNRLSSISIIARRKNETATSDCSVLTTNETVSVSVKPTFLEPSAGDKWLLQET